VYFYHTLQAYSNVVMTSDLKIVCRAVSHKLCGCNIVSMCTICEHFSLIEFDLNIT